MTITLFCADLLGLGFFGLSRQVIGSRRAGMVRFGDSGAASLLRRIPAHGNVAEVFTGSNHAA